jgi:hypothetical protein
MTGIDSLAREAAQHLADTLGRAAAAHLPGQREETRRALGEVIALAGRALAAAETSPGDAAATIGAARATLARAHAARAADARHGAGQLSLSAQRAPTLAACDEGWRRVEAIVAVAEESARAAATMARELEEGAVDARLARQAGRAAHAAGVAARDARRILVERNHAYTFHARPGFSFGEGWYVAAAAVLAGVAIQIEPGSPGLSRAERFLRDAGLGDLVQAHRSRPRANKQTTDLVARAFEADPRAAQRRLRAAFLGDAPVPARIAEWADSRLAAAPRGRKVLLWIRHATHHPDRNSTPAELAELARRALDSGLVPILSGEAVEGWEAPPAAVDLTLFRLEPIFAGEDMRRAQLQLFEHLRRAHGLVGQVGVTTAGMDGPALMGLPTLYLTQASNVRMREWVGAVPGYEEVIRDGRHLARISATLRRWAVQDSLASGS